MKRPSTLGGWRRRSTSVVVILLISLATAVLSVNASDGTADPGSTVTATGTSARTSAETVPQVEDSNAEPEGACQADANSNDNNDSNAEGTCVDPNATSATAPASSSSSATSSSSNDAAHLQECGLWLAESSIPNAGWGMYLGNVQRKVGEIIPPVDVVIPVIDYNLHQGYLKHHKRIESTKQSNAHIMPSRGGGGQQNSNSQRSEHQDTLHHVRQTTTTSTSTTNNIQNTRPTPKWLMEQYYWDATMTHNYYDAENIDSVVPGLGMLANSHPGMVLAENMGPHRPTILGGKTPGDGAASPYQHQHFMAIEDIPASHEIFVEYGDEWFEDRFSDSFGLSEDYRVGNILLDKWVTRLLNKHESKVSPEVWKDLAALILSSFEGTNPRLHEVLSRVDFLPPIDARDRLLAKNNPAAYASVPNAQRTPEWLQENGLCLDHITVGDSTVAPGEQGAFASRHLPKGTVVAPAPVVHMSRDHLAMLLMDDFDADTVLWKGSQLLLNYVYGHVESSLLFFPYAPAVNLINHYQTMEKQNQQQQQQQQQQSSPPPTTTKRPNVKLQWSSKMPHPEWLESWAPEDIMKESNKAGMVMEIVAIADIQEGEEILLDYGNAWQSAFEEHQATTNPPPLYKPVDWKNEHELLTINDDEQYPGHVETVCWIADEQLPLAMFDKMQETGEPIPEEWIPWLAIPNRYLSNTLPCDIVGRTSDGAFYNVVIEEVVTDQQNDHEEEIEVHIKDVPREAITIVSKPYSGAEFRRDAFRHEIQLPEEMVPEHWRDLNPKPVSEEGLPQCNLFMAESSTGNGWGMYRGFAKPLLPNNTHEIDHFCQDLVIQVGDFELSQVLRIRYHNQKPDPELDTWMLTDYAWKSDESTKGGNLEAEEVISVIPGCGSLAQVHPLLYNSQTLPPERITTNTTDPSLGATTHYHNSRFVEQFKKKDRKKLRTMSNGAEILIKGDKILMNYTDDIKAAKKKLPDRVRSQDWLEQHGSCLDNIRPGPSSIPLAGNGAFATRRIREGQVISPVPLLHLHRHHMEIFSSTDAYDPTATVNFEGQRLLLNYCYGHPESSLLLFPYSPVVNYINHAPIEANKESNSPVANAKLQWSSQFNTQDWLNMSPEELLRTKKEPGLAMEIVATREIAPDEEILLDYGSSFGQAWERHVSEWSLAEDWNYEPPKNDWLEWVHTEDEHQRKVLQLQYDRPDKFLGCYVEIPVGIPLHPDDEGDPEELPEFEWHYSEMMFRSTRTVHRCEIIERAVQEGENFAYALGRKQSVAPIKALYTAIISFIPETEVDDLNPKEQQFLVYNMPRRAIEVFDESYSSPQFYRGAFRHEIGLPEDLVPDAWRDLRA